MGVVDRIDGYQRRHRWVGQPLAVVYKFFDDQGNFLTAMITYYGFLSLFPLLLLLVTILGFLLQGNEHLQERVLESALSELPVFGDQIGENIHSFTGSGVAVVVGILGSVYGSLGVAQATQNAFNKMWGVPRDARPNPLRARLRSMLALVVVGTGIVVSTVLAGLATTGEGPVGVAVTAVATLAAVAVNAGLFVFAFRVLTGRPLTVRQVLPGSVAAAIAWQLLQSVGTYYLGHALKGASATYGLFGIVLGLLAWIYLLALAVLLCAEINVVCAEKLWPRSLLTPFTDNVRLTQGDRRAYQSYAETERHKGFESVDVDFDQASPDEATR